MCDENTKECTQNVSIGGTISIELEAEVMLLFELGQDVVMDSSPGQKHVKSEDDPLSELAFQCDFLILLAKI